MALDAAFGSACACIVRRDGECFYASGCTDIPHSQSILPMLKGLLDDAGLDWNALEALALGVGPGSFTGLRVAAAVMAGINADPGLPMIGISSLAVTATQSGAEKPVWVIEDARSGEAYLGLFQTGVALQKTGCRSWNDIRRMPPAIYISQTESPVEMREWRRLPPVRPRAEALADMVRMQLRRTDVRDRQARFLIPTYLRPSQAEQNLRSTKRPRAVWTNASSPEGWWSRTRINQHADL